MFILASGVFNVDKALTVIELTLFYVMHASIQAWNIRLLFGVIVIC